ncbi:MAG: ACP S-malonyltransferase [Halobacteriovoraceae bacterium]|nr:ACP S-malonyltransferase [Halobacteriovoraceae bacterium]
MANSVILLFPGQGSQYVGMGKNLSDGDKFFSRADEVLGYSLSQLCFEGPLDELTLTENAQPAILTHSMACLQSLKSFLDGENINIELVMGHSVGEYAALVAAGVLSFKDAIHAVHMRGKFMQEASSSGLGKMVACMRVSSKEVMIACENASQGEDLVVAANFNAPDQTVISGTNAACARAVSRLKEKHARFRGIELKVSAPFHCPLMKPAREKLRGVLEKLNFQENKIGFIANRDAKLYPPGTKAEVIKENLIYQVTDSVLWLQSMQLLPEKIACIESGPGKVLAGLTKKIDPDRLVFSLDEKGSLDNIANMVR